MNEPVDRLIEDRARLEDGFSRTIGLSVLAHALLVGAAFAAPFLLPKAPPLRVQDGFAVPMPPGGGGVSQAAPPPATAAPVEAPAAPPEPPPKVLKPPRDEPRPTRGLPAPDAKKGKPKAEPARGGGVPGGTGAQTPGLEFGPPGPGVPGGTDPLGDWYLAGVQRKIWLLWTQQIRTGMTQPITVAFTILADGTVVDVRKVQSSGVFLLDQAAQRAILTAAPFGPLPKEYETSRLTIQAIFKPTN